MLEALMTATETAFPQSAAYKPLRDKVTPVTLAPGLETSGVLLRFSRDEEIFGQEDDTASIYMVVEGVVRASRVLDDGRRHIVAFYYPGDLFGIEAGDVREFSAEAVTDCRVYSVRRTSVAADMDRCGFSARDLWAVMARELRRTQGHSFLLSRQSAVERVWSFLKDSAQRQSQGRHVDLPMSRIDIADHLGLTIETVSRAFTQLRREGAIEYDNARHIALRAGEETRAAA
jgi:CRP/FNR family transcriptional regulator, nitrogen fixation regulation protein